MSVDLTETIKTTLETLFDDQTLGEYISQPTEHPHVQYWMYSALSWLSAIPIVNVLWAGSIFFGRTVWFWAHYWNIFWWTLGASFFFQFFWLWILDGWGWLDMDWVYQIFAPLNEDGHYGIVEEWVTVNTWTMAYTIEIIEKDTGVTFDATNETHMQKLKDYTWPYIFEQMNLINIMDGSSWMTNTFWFLFCPQMYVDNDGNALDGYPLMLAKSHELSKMYWGDYSWLEDPYNKKIKLELLTFFGTFINIIWGGLVYTLNIICGDIPAYISIWTQIFEYFK